MSATDERDEASIILASALHIMDNYMLLASALILLLASLTCFWHPKRSLPPGNHDMFKGRAMTQIVIMKGHGHLNQYGLVQLVETATHSFRNDSKHYKLISCAPYSYL